VSETILILEGSTGGPVVREARAGVVAACTAPRPGGDGTNEDCAAVIEHADGRLVLVVADGMGGHPGGDRASGLAIECFAKTAGREVSTEEELRSAILESFDVANRRIQERLPGSGTTAVVAEIDGVTVRVYHCGDSAALVTGGRGKLRMRTTDHSPVGYALESGLLTPKQALAHDHRHVISNFLGSDKMKVEMSPPLELRPRDVLVLGSDGLYDNLLDTEIAETVRIGPLGAAVGRLAEAASARMKSTAASGTAGKPDDLTLIAFRRGPAPGKPEETAA